MTQQEYIEILFNDCGFTNIQMHGYISDYFSGKRNIDELTRDEKSILIYKLVAIKDAKNAK